MRAHSLSRQAVLRNEFEFGGSSAPPLYCPAAISSGRAVRRSDLVAGLHLMPPAGNTNWLAITFSLDHLVGRCLRRRIISGIAAAQSGDFDIEFGGIAVAAVDSDSVQGDLHRDLGEANSLAIPASMSARSPAS